jgi:hypothetical protein
MSFRIILSASSGPGMIAATNAWEQIGVFFGLLVFAFWLSAMDHTDGEESLTRRATWKDHAYKIDPGMALSRSKETS